MEKDERTRARKRNSRKYYLANTEKILKRTHAYYEANKEKVIARSMKYDRDNPEEARERWRKSSRKHAVKRAIYQKEWRAQNKDKMKIKNDRNFAKNKDAIHWARFLNTTVSVASQLLLEKRRQESSLI